ncbi:helix-turn-helix domain-containing protein [Brevundimonas sp. VNH65]|uniref:helix-turn-helix domain-containing protein n=1 Tax=Brevundimonas sp. VNH65 TaxID=3400917 RepID=UPI003C09F7F5
MSTKTARAGRERTHHIDLLIGRRLRDLRDLRGWSQAQVGAGLGVSAERIGQMEAGERIPASRLWQFCGLFGIDVTDVFAGIPQTIGPVAPTDGMADVASAASFIWDDPRPGRDATTAPDVISALPSEIARAASGLSGLEQLVLLRLLLDAQARRK